MTRSSGTRGRLEGWPITFWAAVAILLMVASIFQAMGWNERSLHVVIRSTAQTSFFLFFLAFTASSLHRLRPSRPTRWLLRNRRYLGVGFAVSHLVHLDALVALGVAYPEPFRSETGVVTLVGGGLAYLFIVAMALTSSDRAQAWLGRRRWRRLHVVGSYYIWALFAQSYLPRAWMDLAYLPFAVAVIAAVGLRASPLLLSKAATLSNIGANES